MRKGVGRENGVKEWLYLHKREGHTTCGSKMGKRGVSSGCNYEKRYTYILGYENGVSSGFKCEKGNGHTYWDTKME